MSWEKYAGELAELAEWNPSDVVGRDLLAQVRGTGADWAVASEGFRRIREIWRTLPDEVRGQALAALDSVVDGITSGIEQLDGVPIAEWVAAVVKQVVKIVQGVQQNNEQKQSNSDFAKGAAQRKTLGFLHGGAGVYSVLPVFEYAEFVKIRAGGDFDRRPCFKRNGGLRDAIFTGAPTPGDTGDCLKEMRRSGSDSYGPFDPKCGHKLGFSALFYPWWSAAYSPGPITQYRWRASVGGFDAGVSPDNNALLVGIQTSLLTDPAKNAMVGLGRLDQVVNNLLAWFDGAGEIVPVKRKGADLVTWSPSASWYESRNIPVGHRPRIDARRDPKHVPSAGARAYWYRDAGTIVAYPAQPNADPDTWGKPLPNGKPANLAASLSMVSGVVAMRSAFAARRLATVRSPQLAQALIADYGISKLDPGLRAALEHAARASGTLLPYPGVAAPRRVQRRAIPQRVQQAATGSGAAGPVAALAALGLLLLRKS